MVDIHTALINPFQLFYEYGVYRVCRELRLGRMEQLSWRSLANVDHARPVG